MAIVGEDLGDSLLAVLWYFVPGTIVTIPIMVMVNNPVFISSIPWQLVILIIFTIGYLVCTIRDSEIAPPNWSGRVNAANYMKKSMNLRWSDLLADSVRSHYSLKNKDYKPIVDGIKRSSFFNISYGLLGFALITGFVIFAIAAIFNLFITNNIPLFGINGFGAMVYWIFASVTVRAFTKTSNYVELRKILMMEQCRKEIENDKEKINIIYENLKKWGMLKEDSIESSNSNDSEQKEKTTNTKGRKNSIPKKM